MAAQQEDQDKAGGGSPAPQHPRLWGSQPGHYHGRDLTLTEGKSLLAVVVVVVAPVQTGSWPAGHTKRERDDNLPGSGTPPPPPHTTGQGQKIQIFISEYQVNNLCWPRNKSNSLSTQSPPILEGLNSEFECPESWWLRFCETQVERDIFRQSPDNYAMWDPYNITTLVIYQIVIRK